MCSDEERKYKIQSLELDILFICEADLNLSDYSVDRETIEKLERAYQELIKLDPDKAKALNKELYLEYNIKAIKKKLRPCITVKGIHFRLIPKKNEAKIKVNRDGETIIKSIPVAW